MVEDKHNRYLTEEEPGVLLPSEGYAIVPPPPGYTPLRAPIQPYSTPAPEMSGFHIQNGSDAAAAAAAAGLTDRNSGGVGVWPCLRPKMWLVFQNF